MVPPIRFCCFIPVTGTSTNGCPKDAAYEITASDRPNEPTDSCGDHVAMMLTDAPHHVITRLPSGDPTMPDVDMLREAVNIGIAMIDSENHPPQFTVRDPMEQPRRVFSARDAMEQMNRALAARY